MDETQTTVEHERCVQLSKYFREEGVPNELIDGTDAFHICVGNVSWGEQDFYVLIDDSYCVSISTLLIVSIEELPHETLLEVCNAINQNHKWLKASQYEDSNNVIDLELTIPIIIDGWDYLFCTLAKSFMSSTNKAFDTARKIIEA
ncbi:hypothetical protein VIN30_01125 [Adlercreutzia sp. R7]|uniref:YbjN domain-containing protein n=1 Tax=Adlercreutzia wanghongyangiae TaxID=3111451 RepID=A0ABU6IF34_9ACTN|nr:hypothetical protein [Adlercreutzia sp. R7]